MDEEEQIAQPPEPKTETERDGPRKPPSRTAIGLPDHDFVPGQNLFCKITKPTTGGYLVVIPRHRNALAFLPSKGQHSNGDEVLATYICRSKGIHLLSDRFAHGHLVRKQFNS